MAEYIYRYKDSRQWVLQINVFARGFDIEGFDPLEWKRDVCGKVIRFGDHGNTNSEFGWEIDHIKPVALGGNDVIHNLQPLFWKNNRDKGDAYPWPIRRVGFIESHQMLPNPMR